MGHPQWKYVLPLAVLLASCARMRDIPAGGSFLKSQEVVIPGNQFFQDISEDDLLAYSRLKPNRKILAFRFNHMIYLLVNKTKLQRDADETIQRCLEKNHLREIAGKKPTTCKSWREFWAYTVGEPTALLNKEDMEKSARQMQFHLQKSGYFKAIVEPQVLYSKDSLSCQVKYNVTPGKPYEVVKSTTEIPDENLAKLVDELEDKGALKPGSIFSVAKLEEQRTTIANYLNNHGYYDFTKDYIFYDVDTTLGSGLVGLNMRIEMPQILNQDSEYASTVPHKKYEIGEVFIHTQFDINNPDEEGSDTLTVDGLHVIYKGEPSLDPDLFTCLISFRSGDLYQKDHLERTYRRISQLGVFRSTTIQLQPKESNRIGGINVLDTHIRLSPAKKQAFELDPQVTNRSGNMGVYGNLVYGHRNFFGGAERLDFTIVAGFEASQTLVQTASDGSGAVGGIARNFKLNTFEIGPELTYRIPRLWPLGCGKSSANSEPVTSFSAAANFQNRPDYNRTISQVRWNYSFIENPNKVSRVNFDLLEFSVIKINKSQSFQEFLDSLNDAFLANSYVDHLILASNFAYTINSQQGKKQRSYYYARTVLSAAGNALNGMVTLLEAQESNDGIHRIAGIRYAQYFKGEFDFRYFYNANDRNGFVLRAYGGIGTPRKNAVALPFEKSFFSGGSNGIRAWQARTLGPGGYRDARYPVTFNNIGEIKLEGNFEYRFKLTPLFNLALFADVGNIWLIHSDVNRPKADFELTRFADEIAIGGGLGFRLDFDFFLVRLDMGMQLKDPAKIEGERWLWQPKLEYLSYLASTGSTIERVPLRQSMVFNLGIGFPF